MADFKIGDRVIRVEGTSFEKGARGTVVGIDAQDKLRIEWDKGNEDLDL